MSSSVLDLVGNLAELFIWIGLCLGGICFLVLLILRASRGSWIETDAVVVEEAGTAQLRWMTIDGELHSRELETFERESIVDPDELHVHYSKRAPHRVRFEASAHGEKVLLALGLILGGLGVVAAILSLVVLFLDS